MTTTEQKRPALEFLEHQKAVQFVYDHEELLIASINAIRRKMKDTIRGDLKITMEPVGEIIERPPGTTFTVAGVVDRDLNDGPDLSEAVQGILEPIRNLPDVATVTFGTHILTSIELHKREERRAFRAERLAREEEAKRTGKPAYDEDEEDEEGGTPYRILTLAELKAMIGGRSLGEIDGPTPGPCLEEMQLNKRMSGIAGVYNTSYSTLGQEDGRSVTSLSFQFDGILKE